MPQFNTRLPTETLEKIKAVAQARGIDRSAAVREYINRGLEADVHLLRSKEAFIAKAMQQNGISEAAARELYKMATGA